MLTANAISGVEEEYLGAGFDGYLAKPVKLNLLQDIINKYIKG
jgi:CheY-like chemotaxis protein